MSLRDVTRPIDLVYWGLAMMPRRLMLALGGAGHRVMQARQLRGIRRRAERRRTRPVDGITSLWMALDAVYVALLIAFGHGVAVSPWSRACRRSRG